MQPPSPSRTPTNRPLTRRERRISRLDLSIGRDPIIGRWQSLFAGEICTVVSRRIGVLPINIVEVLHGKLKIVLNSEYPERLGYPISPRYLHLVDKLPVLRIISGEM